MNKKYDFPIDCLLINSQSDNKSVFYQVLHFKNKEIIFSNKFSLDFTVNLVNFFGIVKALMYCNKNELNLPIFSNNNAAIKWARNSKGMYYDNPYASKVADFAFKKLSELKNVYLIDKWDSENWGAISENFSK